MRVNEVITESVNESNDPDLAELGRILMDRAAQTAHDEMSNVMSVVGSELVKYGTSQGANSPEELVKRTGASMPMIEKLVTYAEKALEIYGPVRSGTNAPDADDTDDTDDEDNKDY